MRRMLRVVPVVLLLVLSGLHLPQAALAQGQVYTDTMDSAATGLLSTESSTPGITYSYQNGQFLVQASEPAFQGELVSFIGVPEMTDVRVTVDVALGGDPANKYVLVGCRANDTSDGYMVGVAPASGQAILFRSDPADDVVLQRVTDTALVNTGNANNQIGIDCTGNVITALINGQQVLATTDSTYTTGTSYIGVGASGDQIDGLTVGFDNLTVTDLAAGTTTLQPTAIPSAPTVAAPTVAAPTVAAPTVAAPTVAAPTVAAPTVAAPAPTEVSAGTSTQMGDPNVDPAATLSDAFLVSLFADPVVGDLGGAADVTIDNVRTLPAGVELADFYAELHFTTPQVPAGTYYLVGFCFWVDPAGNCYDIFVQDDGTGASTWGYGYDSAGEGYETIQTGTVEPGTIDPTVGVDNFLSITVYKGVAILSGNTFTVAAVIPLQGTPIVGDVKAEVGFIQDADAAPSTVTILPLEVFQFGVWDLSSGQVPNLDEPVETETPVASLPSPTTASLPTLAPPDPTIPTAPTLAPTVEALPTTASTTSGTPNLPPMQSSDVQSVIFDRGRTAAIANQPLVGGNTGVLTQEGNVYSFIPGGISAGDFYALVSFTNPTDAATPFDVGIGFRAGAGSDSGIRFVVMSTGAWYLLVPNGATIASGTATNFDAAPGATNTIEVLAQGGVGMIAINGLVLQQVDLSSASAPGDVYIGTGFFQGDTVAGRQVPYADFWVFPLTA